MKKIIVASVVAMFALTGCGAAVSKGNNVEKKVVNGTECIVGTSHAGSIALDCDWGN